MTFIELLKKNSNHSQNVVESDTNFYQFSTIQMGDKAIGIQSHLLGDEDGGQYIYLIFYEKNEDEVVRPFYADLIELEEFLNMIITVEGQKNDKAANMNQRLVLQQKNQKKVLYVA